MAATNEPRVRIFVNGTWTDVTTSVREAAGIVITTGQQDESAGVNPGSCRFTFDNEDGAFTPRNPRSPYFGYLNRNTPMCLMLDEITDAFGRVVASGWSTTDTGETWATKSVGGTISGTDYSVDGTRAVHSVPAVSSYRMSYLGSASGAPTTYNGEILVGPLTLSFTDVTGGALEPNNVVMRAQSDTQYYLVRVTIETDESVKIALLKDGSTVLAAAVTVAGLTHSSSQGLWVRGGAFDSTIYGKVWADGTTEPADWQIEATDTSYGYGYFGLRSGVAAGNTNTKPILFKYGSATIYPSQFNGEIPDWPQEVSDDGRNMIVPIEAAGILRRLQQGKADMATSVRRYYEQFASPAPAYYWPLDEGDLATQGAPTIGTKPMFVTTSAAYGVATQKHFGQVDVGSWLKPGVALIGLDTLSNFDFSLSVAELLLQQLNLPIDASPGTWAIDFVRAGGPTTHDSIGAGGSGATGGGPASYAWSIEFDAVNDHVIISHDAQPADATLTAASFSHQVFDGAAHIFRFSVEIDGSDLRWRFSVDGFQEDTGTISGYHQWTQFIDVIALALMPTDTTISVGYSSIAVFTTTPPTESLPWLAFYGTLTEGADRRFARLCNEEGIANFITTATGDSMGPQFPVPVTEQFREIVATDGGIMRELLSARALHYEPRVSLLNRTTALTLNVGNGETAPPFKPVDDDQILRNKITASKRNGGQFTYELTTGRLGTADPKDGGSGVYDDEVKANPYSESQLPDIAERAVAAGTVDESRFPAVRVNLMSNGIARNLTLRRQVLNTFVSSRITLTNMGDFHVYTDADLLVVGFSKILTPSRHEIEFTCLPFAPYRAFVLDTDRLDTETSTLTSGIAASGVTTFQVSDSSGSLWTTDGGDFPLTVFVGGEPITISAISGASSPQTFTVSARTSAATTHAAGTAVSLAAPTPLG